MPFPVQRLALKEGELARVGELLARVFAPGRGAVDYLRWLYGDNPEGEALLLGVWVGNCLVAHMACLPFPFAFRGHRGRAALCVHMVVHPQYRRKGLACQLVEAAWQAAVQEGWDSVVAVANRRSGPLFGRQGFQEVGPLAVFWGVGFPAPAKARGEQWQRLWSLESLQWRLNPPGGAYKIQAHGNHLWCLAPSTWPFAVLLGAVPQELGFLRGRPSFRRPLRVWMGLGRERYFHPPRWWPWPVWGRPSTLILFMRAREGRMTPERAEVFFQGLDFDAF